MAFLPQKRLEIIALDEMDALAALQGGATSIEVCNHMDQDGLSPSPQTVKEILLALHNASSSSKLHVNVMVRSRGGSNFEFTSHEIRDMEEQARCFVELGADGLVLGCLCTPQGRLALDADACSLLTRAAFTQNPQVVPTLHRAFDALDSEGRAEALTKFSELGIQRLLTFGFPCFSSAQGPITNVSVVLETLQRIRQLPGLECEVATGGFGARMDVLNQLLEGGITSIHIGRGARIGSSYSNPVDTALVRQWVAKIHSTSTS
jgi:copper homeostasis protein